MEEEAAGLAAWEWEGQSGRGGAGRETSPEEGK